MSSNTPRVFTHGCLFLFFFLSFFLSFFLLYCQDIPLRVLKSLGESQGRRRVRNIPFATVVTDLGGAHPLWFHKEADLCFVPSDACRRIALRKGLAAAQLRQHGLPLRRGFWHPDTRSKDQVRESLGLAVGRRTTLVVGGGDGIGGITGVADALGLALGACTTCGEVGPP
jgi:1,2-diacylglycerol 3-beta-galactosyltransferase